MWTYILLTIIFSTLLSSRAPYKITKKSSGLYLLDT